MRHGIHKAGSYTAKVTDTGVLIIPTQFVSSLFLESDGQGVHPNSHTLFFKGRILTTTFNYSNSHTTFPQGLNRRQNV